MSTLAIFVNGSPQSIPAFTSAHSLLELLGIQPKGVAVALNESILPRSEWANHKFCEGDRIEIVTAAAGG